MEHKGEMLFGFFTANFPEASFFFQGIVSHVTYKGATRRRAQAVVF